MFFDDLFDQGYQRFLIGEVGEVLDASSTLCFSAISSRTSNNISVVGTAIVESQYS